MKIYLATTAPGTEGKNGMLPLPRRLLSYYHIIHKQFECHYMLRHIQRFKRGLK